MKQLFLGALVASLIALAQGPVAADNVTVKGVHLCCGACVAGAQKALDPVDGVTNVAADRNSKIVTFDATGKEAAQNGVNALAKAGFHGTATHGDEKLEFPASGVKPGEKADVVTFTGVHLCCGACVTGAQQALQNVKALKAINIDRKERLIRLEGAEIDVVEAVTALNDGGFHGTVVRNRSVDERSPASD